MSCGEVRRTEKEARTSDVVVVLQVLKILFFILSQSLGNVGVLNDIQDSLCLVLETLVRQKRVLAFLLEF